MSNAPPSLKSDPNLRCPVTGSLLIRVDDELVSSVGGLRYPIRDGIPVLLPDQAVLPLGVGSLQEFRVRFEKE